MHNPKNVGISDVSPPAFPFVRSVLVILRVFARVGRLLGVDRNLRTRHPTHVLVTRP